MYIIVTQLDKDLAMIDALRELRVELRGHKEVYTFISSILAFSGLYP